MGNARKEAYRNRYFMGEKVYLNLKFVLTWVDGCFKCSLLHNCFTHERSSDKQGAGAKEELGVGWYTYIIGTTTDKLFKHCLLVARDANHCMFMTT